jgi:hypothetical protein
MFTRRALVLMASITIGLPGALEALPFSGNENELPSSFTSKNAKSSTRSVAEIGGLENQATLALNDKTNIFSHYKFPGVSFENAASSGLSAARPERTSLTIEQLVAAAGIKRDVYATPPAQTSFGPDPIVAHRPRPPAVKTGPTLRDLAQSLVNKPGSADDAGNDHDRRRQNDWGGGFSFFDAVLETQLDDTFIETARDVARPSIGKDGVVAVNLFGLRDFAFMVSPVSNRIQILDFRTGTTLTVGQSGHENHNRDFQRNQQSGYRPAGNRDSGMRDKIIDIMKGLRTFLNSFVLHPITLGVFLLLSLCWGVIGMSRRAG